VRDEIVTLIDESIDGAVRVRRIVQDLRDFAAGRVERGRSARASRAR
jgi:hypothetical protein